MNQYLKTKISAGQARDTGMAFVLILLFLGLILHNYLFIKIAIAAQVMNMVFPKFYWPLAVFWLSFSQILGTVVSKIILTLVFFLIVTPVGLVRRLLGKDSLQLKKFKKGRESVMKVRNHTFSREDIEKPF
ncbi:MAG: hypothetical protein Kow0042_04560 [Calditrichia bacterium]